MAINPEAVVILSVGFVGVMLLIFWPYILITLCACMAIVAFAYMLCEFARNKKPLITFKSRVVNIHQCKNLPIDN